MGKECGAYLKSEAIGVAKLLCGTDGCPLVRGRLLFVDDKSGLLSPSDQRARLETRGRVLAGMECVVGEAVRQPRYQPLSSGSPVAPKKS